MERVLTDKVLWTEGSLLGQQHFQQHERHLMASMLALTQWPNPDQWGIFELNIDKQALLQHEFSITRLKAILPNGFSFHFEACTQQPLCITLSSEDNYPLTIYAAIPKGNGANNIKNYPNPNALVPFSGYYQTIPDTFDGNREHELLLGKPNLILLKEDEVTTDFHVIKCAKIIKTSDSTYELDDKFIPPINQLHQSEFLVKKLLHLYQLCKKKYLQLKNIPEQHKACQLLIAFLAELQFFLKHRNYCLNRIHEFLFKYTIIFDAGNSWHMPKAYDKNDVYHSFMPLIDKLADIASAAVCDPYQSVVFNKTSGNQYVTNLLPFNKTYKAFYLKINTLEVITLGDLKNEFKLSSMKTLPTLLQLALPGIELIQVSPPKEYVSAGPNDIFLKINTDDNVWQQCLEEKTCALFVCQLIPAASYCLIGVMQ